MNTPGLRIRKKHRRIEFRSHSRIDRHASFIRKGNAFNELWRRGRRGGSGDRHDCNRDRGFGDVDLIRYAEMDRIDPLEIRVRCIRERSIDNIETGDCMVGRGFVQ